MMMVMMMASWGWNGMSRSPQYASRRRICGRVGEGHEVEPEFYHPFIQRLPPLGFNDTGLVHRGPRRVAMDDMGSKLRREARTSTRV